MVTLITLVSSSFRSSSLSDEGERVTACLHDANAFAGVRLIRVHPGLSQGKISVHVSHKPRLHSQPHTKDPKLEQNQSRLKFQSRLKTSRMHAKGVVLRKDVFLPSKHLLSAFYTMLPSKNSSKNLVFTQSPYRRLLRTLLRSTCC